MLCNTSLYQQQIDLSNDVPYMEIAHVDFRKMLLSDILY